MNKKIRMNQSCLFQRSSKSYIAKRLSSKDFTITKNDLKNIERNFDKEDSTFYQLKTSKYVYNDKPKNYSRAKYRQFTNPSPKRKNALKNLNKILSEIKTPKYLFSKSESSYKENATYHRGHTKFLLMDIKSFFPNCKFKMIKENFFASDSGLKMDPDTADCMAKLVTVPNKSKTNREVPQGFPTSGLICFFSYKKMFDKINEIAIKYKLSFSTYVDDLTFSSNYDFDYNKIIMEVCSVLKEFNHSSKVEKCKYIDTTKQRDNGRGVAAIITGVYVRRWKIRASSKIHNKAHRIFNYLKSTAIVDSDSYFACWEKMVQLIGLYETINYIEPQTKEKRIPMKEYINKNKSHFILNLSPTDKRFKIKEVKERIYNAYLSGSLSSIYNEYKK